MSFKPRAILKVEGDIRILPFWAEYHRHIFDSGIVIIPFLTLVGRQSGNSPTSRETEHIIRKLLPDWSIVDSYPNPEPTYSFFQKMKDSLLSILNMAIPFERQSENTPFTINMSSNEFLLDTVPKSKTLYNRYQYQIREGASPNNIVDFLDAIEPSTSDDESCINITFLSENEEDAVQSKIAEMRNDIRLTSEYVHYLDAYIHSDVCWGKDRVILREDANLLECTDFDGDGHCVFSMEPYNGFLKSMVESKIAEATSQHINLETYHSNITEEDHTKIINAMPWKKTESPEIREFAEYMESRVSGILGKKVKIFNDDIWVRICRPSSVTDTDYNPCHRDIYLDFYRNIVNIYVPIVGSNEHSSLAMQSGSHYWNERDLVVTRGGAYFKNTGKKYSVDAILRSRQPLHMMRPNPREDEFILFSPYLIHGCSSNESMDTTRMSLEIRFIEDNKKAKIQEKAFNLFLKERVWR